MDERSDPLRKYLNEYVMPALTLGLIKISDDMPEDPIDALVLPPLIHKPHLFSRETFLSIMQIIDQQRKKKPKSKVHYYRNEANL